MSRRDIEDLYPLSPMQQGMLFHTLQSPESGVYFEQSDWIIHGELDSSAFSRAWQAVVERHSSLRTGFLWQGVDEPLQVVMKDIELPVRIEDWSGTSASGQEVLLDSFLESDRAAGFDLSQPPLMRLALLRIGPGTWHCVWSHHHMLLDGWSLPILFGEVFAMYEGIRKKGRSDLEPARQYRDYIAWLKSRDPHAAEEFWKKTFDRFIPSGQALNLGGNGRPAENGGYTVNQYMLPADLSAGLAELTRQQRLTLNTVLQGAWGLLLSRYTGTDDVVFGATVSGRPPDLPGSESMVGLFINTLPVRVVVDQAIAVIPWLKQLQVVMSGYRQFEYSPLVDIQRWIGLPRNQSFFETLLVVENYPLTEAVKGRNASIRIETGRSFTRTNYPLTVAVSPGSQIGVEIAFNHDRFDGQGVDRLFGHLQGILNEFLTRPSGAIGGLEMMSPQEKQRLVNEFARGGPPAPVGCVHDLIVQRARKSPADVAVVSGGRTYSYSDLESRSGEIACDLRTRGAGRGDVVAVALDRSFDLIATLLGIHRAGAAYLPLNLAHPQERLEYILRDSAASLLLTRKGLLGRLPQTDARIICIDLPVEMPRARPTKTDSPMGGTDSEAGNSSRDSGSGMVAEGTDGNLLSVETRSSGPVASPDADVEPDDLAYLIYTSGSTGEPKGVEVTHRGLGNHALWAATSCALGPSDRVLQFISLSFDAAAEEIFPSLVSGAALVLHPSPTELSADQLVRFCDENEVTMLHLPVAYWHQWVEEIARGTAGIPQRLRVLVVGGESPKPERIRQWFDAAGTRVRVLNFYGPTETTITATTHEIAPGEQNVPIGRPIRGVEVFIFDRSGRPAPPGVAGELFIGGTGLARGYARRPDLTAGRFVPHPCPVTPGERLYATGDICRFRADGELEFIGRLDNQVKVRGFRVELEEIEGQIQSHPDVGAAVVIVRKDSHGENRLLAYVVGRDGGVPSAPELQKYLRKHLPEYMVPDLFGILDAFPMSAHGKIDRRALAALEPDRPDEPAGRDLPRTVTEELLAGIWIDILGISAVKSSSDFFQLGGHSLRAMQLVSRIRDVFGVELPLGHVFETSTLEGLAARIDAARSGEGSEMLPPLAARDRSQSPPLSFAQQRLWFLDQLAPGGTFYNIPAAFDLHGPLDVDALKESFREVVRRHEVLRTRFGSLDGSPVQIIDEEIDLDIPIDDLRRLAPEEREFEVERLAREEVQQVFSLGDGPMFHIRVLRLDQERHVVLFTIHHIAADGWSMGILVREIGRLYEAFRAKEAAPLPPLNLQYADFAAWQRGWLQGEVLERQMGYWRDYLRGSPPVLELPLDHPRPAVQTFEGSRQTILCGAELSAAIKELSRSEGVTTFMTLLAAFQALLGRYSGQTDILVGTPVAGRTRSELEQLIGFFVNTLVVRTDLGANPTVRELLQAVRESCLGAFAHQDVPFEKLVEEIAPSRDLSHSPIFQVMFVWQNIPPVSVELPGLNIRSRSVENRSSTFDLTLVMQEGPGGLFAEMEYNSALFEPGTIERMLSHFVNMLTAFVRDPDQRVLAIPILSAEDSVKQLAVWNSTAAEFPSHLCVHEVFESLASINPSGTALVYRRGPGEEEKREVLTYGELNVRANQLARTLMRLGVGPEQIVGIFAERSPEMVVAMLGVLKAGGAFLPLDPGYPPERLAFMIEDSGIQVLLTQSFLRAAISRDVRHVVSLDDEWASIGTAESTNPGAAVSPENLAYVIYTSGSTGRPKGTMLPHRGLCNLAKVQRTAFGIDGVSNVLQFSSLSFDASVWESVMALLNGAALTLTTRDTIASAHELAALIRQEGVTTVTLPPSVLAVFPPETLPGLRTIITAGERCTLDLVRNWGQGRMFFNAYGPTETTVCATMHRCDGLDTEDPPIGRPISNFQVYILDRQFQPVPIGVPGELCVGGVGLARGYLRRPDLTADRFLPNPFAGGRGERLYRTGDLCRYRPDGSVEFLGRVDHQVKIRGFRVEPGEIEAALREIDGVQDVVVIAREDVPGDRRLAAYLVMPVSLRMPAADIKSRLRERLPEFMIPSAFVFLDAMPLTPSKKIDRHALPAPERSREDLAQQYVAPRNDDEAKLAEIAALLLNIERVGVEDNFFELGGHSLLATQFVSRIRDAFQAEMPLRTLFEKPTIAELASEIPRLRSAGSGTQTPRIKAISRDSVRVKRSEVVSSS